MVGARLSGIDGVIGYFGLWVWRWIVVWGGGVRIIVVGYFGLGFRRLSIRFCSI